MKICLIALALVGTSAMAQPSPAAAAAAPAQPQIAAEKTQFDAYADKELADLQAFVAAAKADLDKFQDRETARLEAVGRRTKSEEFPEAEKTQVKALRKLLSGSSPETRQKALGDLQDKLRTEKMISIWKKYKTKKKALWAKFEQDWQKLLTQPPLLIRKTSAAELDKAEPRAGAREGKKPKNGKAAKDHSKIP